MKFLNSFIIILINTPTILCLVFNDALTSNTNTFGTLPTISELECPRGVLGLKMENNCGAPGYQHPNCHRTLLVQQSLDEGKLVEALQYANTDESKLALDIVLNNGNDYDSTDDRLSNCTHLVVEAMIRKQNTMKAAPLSNITLPSKYPISSTSYPNPISAYAPLSTLALIEKRSTIKATCTDNGSFGVNLRDYLTFESILSTNLDIPIVFKKSDGNKERAVIDAGNDISIVAYRIITSVEPQDLNIRQFIPLVLAGRNNCWPKYNGDGSSGDNLTSPVSTFSEIAKSPTITSKSLALTAYIIDSDWVEYF